MKGKNRVKEFDELFEGVDDSEFMKVSCDYLKKIEKKSNPKRMEQILCIENIIEFMDELYWYTLDISEEKEELNEYESYLFSIMRFSVETGNGGILSLFEHLNEEEIEAMVTAFDKVHMPISLLYLNTGMILYKLEDYQEERDLYEKVLKADEEFHERHKKELNDRIKYYLIKNINHFH